MKNSHTFRGFWRFFRAVALIDVLIFLLAGAICLMADWRTLHEYGGVLSKVGTGGLILVLLLGMGANPTRHGDLAALAKSGNLRLDEIFYSSNREYSTRARVMLIGASAMVIAIVVGSLLQIILA